MDKIIESLLEIPEETNTIEFKRFDGGSKNISKIIESIAAMSNTEGGTIVLGIDDPEKTKLKGEARIYGIEENKDHYDALGREIQKIEPPLSGIWPPELIQTEEGGRRIALIKIPKASEHLHSVDGHVYVRQEKSNKRLSTDEAIQFSYARGFQKADKELVDVDFNLLNTEYYIEWVNARGLRGKNVQEILEKTGLARKEKSKLLPTRAAVLLFAEYPTDLMDTKCTIRVFQYTGTIETLRQTPNLIGLPKTISGPVVKLIKDAHVYVLNLLRSGIRIPSGFVTQYQMPERAVQEAITNAVIHRDYHIKKDIIVKIFEDRIEIENAGLLPYNITARNIGRVRADGYRNDLLVKHLREFPSPPNLDQNEGVRAMRNEMDAQNLYPPIFWTYPHIQNAVRVILLNEKRASEWEKVNFFFQKHKYITNAEAREVTKITQRDKMSKMLKKWVEQGLLLQIKPSPGYMKGYKYKLANASELSK